MIFNRSKRHRRTGDRYRDARDWTMAETYYRLHLQTRPQDAAIWVQLGHAVKEQGRMADALTAYGRGAALEPDNRDTQQHLLFVRDRVQEAGAGAGAGSAQGGAALSAAAMPALAEPVPIVVPAGPVRRTAALPDGITLFSLQDLFGYLRAHVTMSGIQRVQAGIVLHAIAEEGEQVGFVLNDMTPHYRDGEFLLIDNDALQAMIDYASGDVVDHHKLRLMLAECEDAAVIVRPAAGCTIILLGAFWGHGNTIDRYMTAKRDGAKIGAYVYDIIPISHPQYCEPGLVADFTMSISELGLVVDFIFTISDYTRRTLGDFYRDNGVRDIPMTTVPLAHSLTAATHAGERWPASLEHIRGRRYVAYVSTVEGRKNHAYVVAAWQQLIADGVDVPDLVFVGRRGWRINGLLDLLDGTRNLGGRVHIVHDLSDAELNGVYAGCAFTVFTSFVEGWGLPVGESLVHHVPCVASSTSSVPEVGGTFVDYVDPLNLRAGIETFRRMIVDAAYLDGRRREIETKFVPRSWSDVGRDFIARMRAAADRDYPVRPIYPTLPEGSLFRPGDLLDTVISNRRYATCPGRLLLTQSFFRAEPHGAWLNGNSGSITFLTDAAPDEEVVVYLELIAAAGAEGREVSVRIGEAGNAPDRASRIDPARRTILRARGRVSAERVCTVRIAVSGPIGHRPNDTRLFVIGLAAIGYARADNPVAREDLVERFFIQDLSALG